MPVRTAPRIFIKHKARTLSNIEIRFDYTDFGKNVFVKFFFKDCPLASSAGICLFDLVLVVKAETDCSKNQIKKLQRKMF